MVAAIQAATTFTKKHPAAHCASCPLYSFGGVASVIHPNSKVVLVSPGPGKQGAMPPPNGFAPISVQSQQFVKAVLENCGIDPTGPEVSYINATLCGWGRQASWPPAKAITACRDRLWEEIEEADPKVIITLGREALEALVPDGPKSLFQGRGYTFWRNGYRIVPTWHPHVLYARTDSFMDFVNDIRGALLFDVVHPKDDEIKYGLVRTPAHVEILRKKLQGKKACCDIETSGFDAHGDRILCIAISVNETTAAIIPETLIYDPLAREVLQQLFSDPAIDWVFHNGKFDVRFLSVCLDVRPYITDDTMLLHYALDERLGTHGLKELCQTKLGLSDYEAKLHAHLPKKSASYALIPKPVLHEYAARDVCYTIRLLDRLNRELAISDFAEDSCRLYRFLVEAENGLSEIEANGLYVDKEYARRLDKEFVGVIEALIEEMRNQVASHRGVRRLATLRERLEVDSNKELAAIWGELDSNTKKQILSAAYTIEEAPYDNIRKTPVAWTFNPNSFQQVQWFLYDLCEAPEVQLFRNHKPRSTNREALDKILEHPATTPEARKFVETLIQYREVKKIHSTYVSPILELTQADGRCRTDFRLHGTVTGRLASSDPNLMNIPRPTKNEYAGQIRNLFIASPGHVLIGADYSQAELRVLAHFSKDPFLLNAYAKGLDLHTEAAIMLFGEDWKKEDRMIAKMLNFGLVYGRTAHSIAVERQMPIQQAEKIVSDFFKRMPHVYRWLNRTRQDAVNNGYLFTPTGRVRRFGLVTEKNENEVRNQATNFPIQATSSDICLRALLDIHQWLKQTGMGKALLMVHDSIIVEVPEKHAEEVKVKLIEVMLAASKKVLGPDSLDFAVDIDVATKWGEL